ncbi:putative Adenine deaminase [Seiridium unicorne]|uniref:adenine deaminase n=1 Tax=Seiridium unicorne TaxID=138068 RepID=A0ABR2ULJ5_9PEZI
MHSACSAIATLSLDPGKSSEQARSENMSLTLPESNATGAHLTITPEELFQLRHVARGTAPPSIIIRHGTVLSLHTGEFLERDVIIKGRHIAAITPWDYFPTSRYSEDAAVEEVDAGGKFVSPGFIDTHLHIEYTKLTPGELARLSVPRGTTTVLADANCIANVLGGKGMDYMGTTTTPLRIFRQVSHKVPMSSPEIELGGTSLSTEEICSRVSRNEAATLGESNPFSLDMASARKQAAALHAGKRITGHSALLVNEPLWAYCAGGISDDHNAHRPIDVIERLRLGMMLTVMSGSMNSNIEPVFSNLELYKDGLGYISFCADDKYCEDFDKTGHIDHHVRRAIELGVPVIEAYKMATINAASYYRLDHLIGSVTPGKLADLLILEKLEDARPSMVIGNGSIVARDNKALFSNTDPVPDFTLNTIHIHSCHLEASSYHLFPLLPATKAWVQCVEMYDGYFKRAFHTALPVNPETPHNILCDVEHDVLKVVIVDRHHATENRGIAFVRGFGLKRGAIAATTNCENQNLVVIGVDDESIAAAVTAMRQLGGGMLAVNTRGERVLGTVKLDVAGCMSSAPWEEVRDTSLELDRLVREELGCTMEQNPFLIASFVGLVAVPDLGLTELGLVIGGGEALMNPVLDTEPITTGDSTRGGEKADTDLQAVRVCCRCPSHIHTGLI